MEACIAHCVKRYGWIRQSPVSGHGAVQQHGELGLAHTGMKGLRWVVMIRAERSRGGVEDMKIMRHSWYQCLWSLDFDPVGGNVCLVIGPSLLFQLPVPSV